MMKKFIYSLICTQFLIFNYLFSDNSNFDILWLDMQIKYLNLDNKFSNQDLKKSENKFFTNYWLSLKDPIRNLIIGNSNKNFLGTPGLSNAMVRGLHGEFGLEQRFEECYLTNCLSSNTQLKIKKIQDCDLLPRTSKLFNCSTSTLGHLFYAAKIIENFDNEPKVIVELGGGYGNLTRLLKQIFDDTTIVMFDFPEVLAIQYLFLKYTLPGVKIICHENPINGSLEKGIHLVPVFVMDKCKIDSDIFVSTFALTETPEYVQNVVIENKFFNSKLSYVTGQINGWQGIGHLFVDHKNVMDGLRSVYKKVKCELFHIFSENQFSFETIAIKG